MSSYQIKRGGCSRRLQKSPLQNVKLFWPPSCGSRSSTRKRNSLKAGEERSLIDRRISPIERHVSLIESQKKDCSSYSRWAESENHSDIFANVQELKQKLRFLFAEREKILKKIAFRTKFVAGDVKKLSLELKEIGNKYAEAQRNLKNYYHLLSEHDAWLESSHAEQNNALSLLERTSKKKNVTKFNKSASAARIQTHQRRIKRAGSSRGWGDEDHISLRDGETPEVLLSSSRIKRRSASSRVKELLSTDNVIKKDVPKLLLLPSGRRILTGKKKKYENLVWEAAMRPPQWQRGFKHYGPFGCVNAGILNPERLKHVAPGAVLYAEEHHNRRDEEQREYFERKKIWESQHGGSKYVVRQPSRSRADAPWL
eukprot:g4087.t1